MGDFQILRFEEIADPQHSYAIGDGDHGAISTECYQDSGIPYIRVGDMVNGKISIKKMVYIPEEVHSKNIHQELVPGDIIIAKTGATIGKVAIIPESIPRANTTASVGKISVDHSKVDVRYFFHYLQTHAFTSQMWKVSHKSAQPGFNVKHMKNFTIPLPPLNEQKRVAAILDKANEIKHTVEKSKFSRSQLSQSIFFEMFGDPTQDNTGFEQFKLSEIIEEGDKINYGVVQPGSEFPEGHHLIRAGNVVDGLVPENMKRIDPDIEQKYSRSRIKGNEILIVCVGSIGEVALVREEHIGFNIARAVCRIPVKNSIPRIYVSEYLKLASVQSRIQAEIREVAQPTLNIKQIKELVISIPETSKMEEFERMMNSVSSWESVLSSRSNQIENSLKSIAQELIS